MANHITYDHYAAFGMIINVIADIDVLLDKIIFTMLIRASKVTSLENMVKRHPTILPLLTMLSSKNKTDYIVAMAKSSNMAPIAINGLEGLMKRVRKAHDLRNDIAHCAWMPGTKPGTIKPLRMSAHKALKMLGIEHNEKQWTAAELHAEVKRFQDVGKDLALFMKRYGF